jgi:peptidoglycan/xylan/chitin deacetylase (PgdA/CDA1 family)
LLDTLEGANVTATLFMVGKAATANPEIVRRADAMGIEIGNHTTNHKQLNQQSDNVVRFEIGDTQKRLKAITGRSPTWFRPPYAGRSKRTDAIAGGYRLGVVTWTTSPLDWENTNARTITRLVLNGARRNSIVLMHDTHSWTVDATPAIIKGLKAKGYTLVTLTQLEGRPKPGKLYY